MNPLESTLACVAALTDELRALNVKDLWIFGSAARGKEDARDLDFLVEFTSPPTLTGFMNLKFLLEERLKRPVDLHSKASCPPRFFNRIQPDLLHVA